MPCGRAWKNDRLAARRERRDLVVFFVPGFDAVPPQAVVQRQILLHAPAILREKAGVFIAAVESLELALVVLARNAEQEIREIDARRAAEEDEIAVQLGDRIGVHLVVVKLRAHVDGVCSDNFRKIIAPLKCIIHLLQLVGVGPDREVIEIDAFHAFRFGRQRNDAWRVQRPPRNPCDARLTPTPPTGWPRSVASRIKLKWNSFTAVELSVLVSPSASSCARPEFRALKPGTFAPP